MKRRTHEQPSMPVKLSKVGGPVAAGLVVLTAVSLLAAVAEAGWERQRMATDEDKGFLGISVVASDFAVAAGVAKSPAGEGGAVFVTRDGESWAASSPQTSGGPFDIHFYMSTWFADRSHGYVGGIGEIWVTNDGAASWERIGLGGMMGGAPIQHMCGLRPSGPAWAVDGNGKLLRTDDRGATWPELATPLGSVALTKVVFVDEQHGWVASGSSVTEGESDEIVGYEGGGVALTTDGGTSWETSFSGEPRMISSLRFVDRRHGWLVSTAMAGSAVERTTDGGVSWEPLATPTESLIGPVTAVHDIFFFDPCEGWLLGAVGDNDAGSLWYTRDGGDTWAEVEDRQYLRLGQLLGIPIEARLVTFDFASRDIGWASGSYETLYRYTPDEPAPDCSAGGGGGGGSDPDDGGGGGRCECRAAGASGATMGMPLAFGLALIMIARRRWRG